MLRTGICLNTLVLPSSCFQLLDAAVVTFLSAAKIWGRAK